MSRTQDRTLQDNGETRDSASGDETITLGRHEAEQLEKVGC